MNALETVARREFARLQGDAVYLNSASTGPLPNCAERVAREQVALRQSPWEYGPDRQFGELDRAREQIARLIGASPKEIALMVNTTYGLNLAARCLPLAKGDVVVGTDREFPANVYPWMALGAERGVEFVQVPCRDGVYDEDALIAALQRPRVKALVVSWVSFESGVQLDLKALGDACRARGAYFVVDAIQGLGPLTLNLQDIAVDILACGAQKWLLAPWGTAFAYVRRELIDTLAPAPVGWMSVKGSDDFTNMLEYRLDYWDDARRFEVVTLPFQDVAAFNASLALFHEVGPSAIARRIAERVDAIVAWAEGRDDVTLITPRERARRAGIASIRVPNAREVSTQLSQAAVYHSLREGCIRFSPHFFTPEEHVARALDVIEAGLAMTRA